MTPHRLLADKRPHIRGCDQGSSSVDFRDNPSSKDPTVRTSVSDPRKSIRASLVRRDKERTSSGSGILTLTDISIIDNARMGTCDRLKISGWGLGAVHYLPGTGTLIS